LVAGVFNYPLLKPNFFLLYILGLDYINFILMNKKNTNTLMNSPLNKESSDLKLSIFNKFIKNNSKLIPFNIKFNHVGEPKYFPPFSKE
jgi:hypothetical protein